MCVVRSGVCHPPSSKRVHTCLARASAVSFSGPAMAAWTAGSERMAATSAEAGGRGAQQGPWPQPEQGSARLAASSAAQDIFVQQPGASPAEVAPSGM